MFHVANEKSQHAPNMGINSIWMNKVLDVRIYLFWNLGAWGHSKIYDYMDEGKTPLLLGKFSWNNGGREAQNGPPSSPQNVMLLFYGLPIYVFHTYLIDFSFLKIRNGSHSKLPISKPSHSLHEISISKIICHHFQPGLIPHHKLGVLIQFSIH